MFVFAAVTIGGNTVSIMLGNLSVAEIQLRAGVEFPEECVEYMENNRQVIADKIKPGKWHGFDVPFAIVCGDTDTATFLYSYLGPLSKQFKQQMQIMVQA